MPFKYRAIKCATTKAANKTFILIYYYLKLKKENLNSYIYLNFLNYLIK